VYKTLKGSYQLDNGDGHGTYKDKKHVLVVSKRTIGGVRLAAARGDTEFGRFVSLGFVRDTEKATLVLARRYVASDKEARVSSKVSDEDYLCHTLDKLCDKLSDTLTSGAASSSVDSFIGSFIEENLVLTETAEMKSEVLAFKKNALGEDAVRCEAETKKGKKRKA
jgi:hypothetical protein